MKTNHDIKQLEVLLIELFESQLLSEDDYNLISKYLIKVKNDLTNV